ncbi:hypothetical protein PAHAL_3G307500, partial [Panicum hallii]
LRLPIPLHLPSPVCPSRSPAIALPPACATPAAASPAVSPAVPQAPAAGRAGALPRRGTPPGLHAAQAQPPSLDLATAQGVGQQGRRGAAIANGAQCSGTDGRRAGTRAQGRARSQPHST